MYLFVLDHTYCKQLERKKRVKRKLRLAISQRWKLLQFTYRRNDVAKSFKRNRGDSDDDKNEVPVNKMQILVKRLSDGSVPAKYLPLIFAQLN